MDNIEFFKVPNPIPELNIGGLVINVNFLKDLGCLIIKYLLNWSRVNIENKIIC